MTYVEERGLWHVVDREDGRDVVTACERRVADARTLERDSEPKPLCWRCRERRTGL